MILSPPPCVQPSGMKHIYTYIDIQVCYGEVVAYWPIRSIPFISMLQDQVVISVFKPANYFLVSWKLVHTS